MKNIPEQKIKLSFSGHQTFPFRYTWLKKAYDAVQSNPNIFNEEYALVELGVGKNMVESMRHWAVLTGVLNEQKEGRKTSYTPSDFGQLIFADEGFDPYLEDVGTLWLLHWKISSGISKATTWYYAFNRFTHIEFTKEQLTSELAALAATNGIRVTEPTITRDVDCFVRSYVSSRALRLGQVEDSIDCPLTELGLIQELGQRGLFVFSRGSQRELSDELFVYALTEFWNGLEHRPNTLSFEEIAYGHGSPGLIFKIDEDTLAYRLEQVDALTKGALRYDETSHLRQVYRNRQVEAMGYLTQYYKRHAHLTVTAHAA